MSDRSMLTARGTADDNLNCLTAGRRLFLLGLIVGHGHLLAQAQVNPHKAHQSASAANASVQRKLARYDVPSVTLVNQNGHPETLQRKLARPGPVYLNFIFTSCTTVCPVMSQIFYELQSKLGKNEADVRLVSISIDPLQDTPQRLSAYGRQFSAGANWDFLTGTREASVAVQRAFEVYRGDKMNHPVVSFFRRTPESPWVRIDGFASADQLLAELHRKD